MFDASNGRPHLSVNACVTHPPLHPPPRFYYRVRYTTIAVTAVNVDSGSKNISRIHIVKCLIDLRQLCTAGMTADEDLTFLLRDRKTFPLGSLIVMARTPCVPLARASFDSVESVKVPLDLIDEFRQVVLLSHIAKEHLPFEALICLIHQAALLI